MKQKHVLKLDAEVDKKAGETALEPKTVSESIETSVIQIFWQFNNSSPAIKKLKRQSEIQVAMDSIVCSMQWTCEYIYYFGVIWFHIERYAWSNTLGLAN